MSNDLRLVSESFRFGEDRKVSRVNLHVDSENMYTAGDDSAVTIDVECPWGDQKMANAILHRISQYAYSPYEAEKAFIDPAHEMWDDVRANNSLNTIVKMDFSLDHQMAADVSAPGADEIEDEYPYKSSQQRTIESTLAKTRSLITKTAAEITLKVENLEEDMGHTLRVASDGVTITDSHGNEVTIGSGQIDASEIIVNAGQIKGKLTADHIDASELKVDAAKIYGTLNTKNIELDGLMGVYDGRYTCGYIGGTDTLGSSLGVALSNPRETAYMLVTHDGARMTYDNGGRYGTHEIFCYADGCKIGKDKHDAIGFFDAVPTRQLSLPRTGATIDDVVAVLFDYGLISYE